MPEPRQRIARFEVQILVDTKGQHKSIVGREVEFRLLNALLSAGICGRVEFVSFLSPDAMLPRGANGAD